MRITRTRDNIQRDGNDASDAGLDALNAALRLARHIDEPGSPYLRSELHDDIHEGLVRTLALLADVVEVKDAYTRGHCERVSRYARATASRLRLSDQQRRVACYAALLHDVGKIGISDSILNKPGPLTREERTAMQQHVRIGHDLLRTVPRLREVAAVVLRHHEWFNGRGYPDGVAGDAIPIEARVVSVVDAYCAMLDARGYKPALSETESRAELRQAAGSQFDPLW